MVLASATEAEVGACFMNAQEACSLRTTLEDLGHKHPPIRIQTDNECAEAILNDTVKQKRSRAIDMRFYWLRDRINQNQFVVFWKKGTKNMGDYFTKHHPPAHHELMRPVYFHCALLTSSQVPLRVCRSLAPASPTPLALQPARLAARPSIKVLRAGQYPSGAPTDSPHLVHSSLLIN
jgi:hypothetical protein